MKDCKQNLGNTHKERDAFKPYGWSGKEKRAFRNILLGLRKTGLLKGKDCRFLTLTTSDLMRNSEGYDYRTLGYNFKLLKGRIKTLRAITLVNAGYISKAQAIRLYGRENLFKRFPFEYFKVITNEGNGVIHILYRGWYIPYNWIVDNWMDIHNSWDINIKKLNNLRQDKKGISRYLVSQYISKQGCTYVRFSQSWNWIYLGYSSRWDILMYWVRQGLFTQETAYKAFDRDLQRETIKQQLLVETLWST